MQAMTIKLDVHRSGVNHQKKKAPAVVAPTNGVARTLVRIGAGTGTRTSRDSPATEAERVRDQAPGERVPSGHVAIRKRRQKFQRG